MIARSGTTKPRTATVISWNARITRRAPGRLRLHVAPADGGEHLDAVVGSVLVLQGPYEAIRGETYAVHAGGLIDVNTRGGTGGRRHRDPGPEGAFVTATKIDRRHLDHSLAVAEFKALRLRLIAERSDAIEAVAKRLDRYVIAVTKEFPEDLERADHPRQV